MEEVKWWERTEETTGETEVEERRVEEREVRRRQGRMKTRG